MHRPNLVPPQLPPPVGDAQFRELVEGAPDGVFFADPLGRYVYVNQAGCRMLELPRSEVIGRTAMDFVHPDEVQALEQSRQAMLTGGAHRGTWRVRQAGGGWLPVEVTANRLADGHSQGYVRDISQRIEQEKARADLLERSERDRGLLEAIFNLLPVGVSIADRGGRITRSNPAATTIWRGPLDGPQQDERMAWDESGKALGRDDWPVVRAATRGETTPGDLIRIRCFDGSEKTVIKSAAPIVDGTGAISGAIVVDEDVSALYGTAQKLRASELLFRTVIELLPVGVWIADRDGRITLANAAGTRLWEGIRHVGPDRYTEYRAWWLDTGLPIAPDEWGVARAVRRGETSKSELIRIQCFDGSYKTVINWAAPIRSDAGEITGAVAVNEDVTTLHRTQEQLRAAVRDREHILAVVAHDLRNPLGNLMLYAEIAERHARDAGARQCADAAASIASIAGGMSSLVDDLMVISSQGRAGYSMLKVASVAPHQLALQAADFARPRFEQRGLQLQVHADPEVPEIAADATRILRVLGNLLDNAAKFTERGGTVVLEVREAASSVRFTVSNSGTPLRDEERERLFQPFWQAGHEDRRGVGLGLSICRSMIEAHGGTVWTEAAPGMRLKVSFLLPRVAPLG